MIRCDQRNPQNSLQVDTKKGYLMTNCMDYVEILKSPQNVETILNLKP